MNCIKIFIADDHPVFLQGLRILIESELRFKIVGQSHNGNEALSQIRLLKPDIAILDLSMPEKNGFQVVRLLREEKFQGNFILLTMNDEEETLNAALALGVKGYILKDSAISEIVNAIISVSEGKNYITPKMTNYLVKQNLSAKRFSPQIEKLTLTEQKILGLIAEKKSTNEIASQLFVSARTVDKHRYNICRKLNITGTNSLLKFAIDNKENLI